MKKKLFSLLLSAAAVAFICNCGDETSGSSDLYGAYVVTEPSFVYNDLYITSSGIVLDKNGNQVGTANIATGTIYDMTGTPTEEGVNFGALTVVNPPAVKSDAWVLSAADQVYVIYPSGEVTDAAGNPIGTIIFETNSDGSSTGIGNIDCAQRIQVQHDPRPAPHRKQRKRNPRPGKQCRRKSPSGKQCRRKPEPAHIVGIAASGIFRDPAGTILQFRKVLEFRKIF